LCIKYPPPPPHSRHQPSPLMLAIGLGGA
jgi:hypothetical protein